MKRGRVRLLLLGASFVGLRTFAQTPVVAHQELPLRAASYADVLGVNTHLLFNGPLFMAYQDRRLVESAIAYLGVRTLRDGGLSLSHDQIATLARVARESGIQYDYVLGSGGTIEPKAVVQNLHELLQAAPHSVAAVEGSNEINNLFSAREWAVSYHGQTVDMCHHRYAPVVAAQRDLYRLLHLDPELKTIPIYSFSMVELFLSAPVAGCTADFAADLRDVGDVSAYADFANVHSYPFQGAPPRRYLERDRAEARAVSGKPYVYTEFGYATAESPTASPSLAVDDEVQARYILDATLDLYQRGVSKVFLYELLDNAVDSPSTDLQQHYGLFYPDGRPKPAATALHHLREILADTGRTASSFSPHAVSFTLHQSSTALEQDVNAMHLLLEKADGTQVLLLWAEPALWDAGHRSRLPAATANHVTLSLRRTAGTIRIFDPLVGSEPIRILHGTNAVTLDVVDHPIVVELH